MASQESFEQRYAALRERSEREDLVMFINACFASTGQSEYYTDKHVQLVSIDFLHRYILANYRKVYARTLAAGINHFNQAVIIRNLLRAGSPKESSFRQEEGELIAACLRALPANRVYSLFRRLSKEGVNNRRSRKIVSDYINRHRSVSFDAVKYRSKIRVVARHYHIKLDDNEAGSFLFDFEKQKHFSNPLFESYSRAKYSKQAIYELPFSIAQGFAEKYKIPQAEFLRRIESNMTHTERLRFQSTSRHSGNRAISIDLGRTPLTKLAIYALSLSREERIELKEELHQALCLAAQRALDRFPLQLGRVALVLDRSRSAFGSKEKKRRPLAIAVAMVYLIRATCPIMKSFWTGFEFSTVAEKADAISDEMKDQYPFLHDCGGQTDLATSCLAAMRWQPDQIIVVSDGYENDPQGAIDQIVGCYKSRLATNHPIAFLHANPVFDSQHFAPRRLGENILTIGLRDAEDLGPSLGFAKFASGEASQSDLETYLGYLAKKRISGQTIPSSSDPEELDDKNDDDDRIEE